MTMRAIAARERRSSAGWDARPKKTRKPSALEKAISERSAESRLRFARRHPEVAAAERQLRKARVAMLKRWDHKYDGTPETHEHASRCNQGALARLYDTGSIDRDQLAAGVQIAQVAERIGADVAVKTASLETRVDQTRVGDGSFYERLTHVRHEMTYTRWRGEVRGPIGAVLDMIVGEPAGFTIIARRYRMHNRKAKRLLIDALDLWPRILREVCKEIDQATLAAAQAGILA
jgi:hypothetical protein